MALSGSILYVGGQFSQTADGAVTSLNNIAKFDGANWSALPNHGLNNDVYALAQSGTTLYAGGQFSQTADGTVTNLNNIARLNRVRILDNVDLDRLPDFRARAAVVARAMIDRGDARAFALGRQMLERIGAD